MLLMNLFLNSAHQAALSAPCGISWGGLTGSCRINFSRWLTHMSEKEVLTLSSGFSMDRGWGPKFFSIWALPQTAWDLSWHLPRL